MIDGLRREERREKWTQVIWVRATASVEWLTFRESFRRKRSPVNSKQEDSRATATATPAPTASTGEIPIQKTNSIVENDYTELFRVDSNYN